MQATSIQYIVGCLTITLLGYVNVSYATTKTQPSPTELLLFKLDSSGSRLNSAAIEWSCVEDANTGLFWQKRDPSVALHSHASYTWYQPLQHNSGTPLTYPTASPLNVTCDGYHHDDPSSYCNTDAYTKRVNQTNYCGYDDWRLPTAQELLTLASSKNTVQPHVAAIDLNYFPFYERFVYWTGSVDSSGQVLTVAQENKVLKNALRSDQLLIRLVRGTQY